jgi:hypothetical protein
MTSRKPIDAQAVRALAEYAGLPLAAGREAVLAPTLEAWVADAEALSLKMSAPEHWTLTPATVFTHPVDETGER